MHNRDEIFREPEDFEAEEEDSRDGEVFMDTEPARTMLAEREFALWLSRRRANRLLNCSLGNASVMTYKKPEQGSGSGRPGQ